MTSTTTLTVSGLLAAVLILIANLRPWWKGSREMKLLAPFGKGFGAAACAAACPGGILGWLHTHAAPVANRAGARAGDAATGTSSASGLTSGQLVGLGATGAGVVIVIAYLTVLAYKDAGKKDKRRIIGGVIVGSVLTLTAGVAGALFWLPAALNGVGQAVVDAAQSSGLL
ncbi:MULTISPECIES: hypothetical protein [Streptomyces]|uniref:hypothetical protein n=1 Tax=Streptomyces TaxID=1883 RepID=UPI0016789D65|nr:MULTISPECIES: hypothetical protein [Streptomyces]MBK3524835.1 hypothetical protein [Streptomyces sp. MBT70]GGR71033.1 hypothetical protein GCM10010236_26640 [Streptomyces eurythermus]